MQTDCVSKEFWQSFKRFHEVEQCLAMAEQEPTLKTLLNILDRCIETNSLKCFSGQLFERLCVLSVQNPVWLEGDASVSAARLLVKHITSARHSDSQALAALTLPSVPKSLLAGAIQGTVDRQSVFRFLRLLHEAAGIEGEMIKTGFSHLVDGCEKICDISAPSDAKQKLLAAVEAGFVTFASVMSLPEFHFLSRHIASFVPDLLDLLGRISSSSVDVPSIRTLLYCLLKGQEDETHKLDSVTIDPDVTEMVWRLSEAKADSYLLLNVLQETFRGKVNGCFLAQKMLKERSSLFSMRSTVPEDFEKCAQALRCSALKVLAIAVIC